MSQFSARHWLTALACCAAPLSGCGQFPRDAAGTLAQAREGRPLRVGWSVAEPWVRRGGAAGPAGIEPELIRRWAAGQGIRIDWVEGSEAELVAALGENTLDLAVAGFTPAAPWGAKIGLTQPYLSPDVVIGAWPTSRVPDDWTGVPVAVDPRRTGLAALVRAEGAIPATRPGAFRAAYGPELRALGLVPTGTVLGSERHAIAVAPSENALTLSLDRFLHAEKRAIAARLAGEGRR